MDFKKVDSPGSEEIMRYPHAGQKGSNTKDIQAHLRHAQPNVTANVYMQAIPESVRRAVETLDRLLIPAPGSKTQNDSEQN